MGQTCTPAWSPNTSRTIRPYSNSGDRSFFASRSTTEDLWRAFEKRPSWLVNSESDSWQALLQKNPRFSTWELTLRPTMFDHDPFKMHYDLDILVGSSADGRSTLSSRTTTSMPPQEDPVLNFADGEFELRLWCARANRAFRWVLNQVTGNVLNVDLESDGRVVEFYLTGTLVGQDIIGAVELQVRWLSHCVWRREVLSFGETVDVDGFRVPPLQCGDGLPVSKISIPTPQGSRVLLPGSAGSECCRGADCIPGYDPDCSWEQPLKPATPLKPARPNGAKDDLVTYTMLTGI